MSNIKCATTKLGNYIVMCMRKCFEMKLYFEVMAKCMKETAIIPVLLLGSNNRKKCIRNIKKYD